MEKQKVDIILRELDMMYPDAHCELNHHSAFELLVATILSAQATDKKVNQVTEELFKRINTPEQFAKLTQEQLEMEIKEIGLYHNKAKNIISMSKSLLEKFNGAVPDNMENLTSLAGVGRKTANVVLSNAFNVPAIAVDTHVNRVSNRIGLAESEDVLKVEQQLMKAIPKEMWSKAHHLLIFHGRRLCKAQNPGCENCNIKNECNYYKKTSDKI